MNEPTASRRLLELSQLADTETEAIVLRQLSEEVNGMETKLWDTESDRIQTLSLMEDAQIELREIADRLLGILEVQGESDNGMAVCKS